MEVFHDLIELTRRAFDMMTLSTVEQKKVALSRELSSWSIELIIEPHKKKKERRYRYFTEEQKEFMVYNMQKKDMTAYRNIKNTLSR